MKQAILLSILSFMLYPLLAQYDSKSNQHLLSDQKNEILKEALDFSHGLFLPDNTYTLDSIIYYTYPSASDSIRAEKTAYFYIGSSERQRIKSLWDEGSGTYMNFEKAIWIFDEDGNLIEYKRSYWDEGSNTWLNNIKFESTFNAAGQETLFLYYKWDIPSNDWEYFLKEEYTYDTNGNMTFYYSWMWDTDLDDWVGSYFEEMSYTSTGKLAVRKFYWWDQITNDWTQESKTLYEYDENDFLVLANGYSWNTFLTNWDYLYKDELVNNENGNPILITNYYTSDNGITFNLGGKTEKVYNLNDYEIQSVYFTWNDVFEDWDSVSKNIFDWDEFGNRILDQRFNWQTNLNDWQLVYMTEQLYYNEEVLLMAAVYAYNNELGILVGDYKIEYVVNSDIEPEVSYMYSWDLTSNDWQLDQKGYYYYTITTGMDDPIANHFRILSNPVGDELIIQLEKDESARYSIYSISGNLVQRGMIHHRETKINVTSLPDGIYVFTLENGERSGSVQFLKK